MGRRPVGRRARARAILRRMPISSSVGQASSLPRAWPAPGRAWRRRKFPLGDFARARAGGRVLAGKMPAVRNTLRRGERRPMENAARWRVAYARRGIVRSGSFQPATRLEAAARGSAAVAKLGGPASSRRRELGERRTGRGFRRRRCPTGNRLTGALGDSGTAPLDARAVQFRQRPTVTVAPSGARTRGMRIRPHTTTTPPSEETTVRGKLRKLQPVPAWGTFLVAAAPRTVRGSPPKSRSAKNLGRVERRRIELPTSALRTQRSPS